MLSTYCAPEVTRHLPPLGGRPVEGGNHEEIDAAQGGWVGHDWLFCF